MNDLESLVDLGRLGLVALLALLHRPASCGGLAKAEICYPGRLTSAKVRISQRRHSNSETEPAIEPVEHRSPPIDA